IVEQVADDDHVVNRVRFSGTHEGEFAGIPATHQKVETTGLAMFKFEGDKISEQRVEWHILGMLAQVGAKPMRPQDC
ncbi:MAG: ester cyclase, partial [Thermoplasmata archaeon]|nr:ester cyclase [Thermoplasmata archaeon]